MSRRKRSGLFRRITVLCLVLALAAPAAGAEGIQEADISDITGETQEILAQAALDRQIKEDETLRDIRVRRNGLIFGRGKSDEPSGVEPNYIGLVGYAAVLNNEEANLGIESLAIPWTAPAYIIFDRHWYFTKSMPHKAGVLVIDQILKETGKGQYTGRLKVIRLNTNDIGWMDVENFITVPYWFYPLRRAVRYGSVLTVYYRRSGRSPVDEDGNPVDVAEETRVLVPGTGAWNRKAPDGSGLIPGIIYFTETRMVEIRPEPSEAPEGADSAEPTAAPVMKEITEVTSTVVFFPEEDLRIIY